MTKPAMQRAPSGLGKSGAALWKKFASTYRFDERELEISTLAARQADDIAGLESALAADGLMIAGASGQIRMNACITELRGSRIALARHLGQLDLPDADGPPVTARSAHARRAADSRWEKVRRIEAAQAERRAGGD